MQIYMDHSAEFWPSGWVVWYCLSVGLLDVALIAHIVASVLRHGAGS